MRFLRVPRRAGVVSPRPAFPAGRSGVARDLDPGYFALVMATGIVARGTYLDGAGRLSAVLLGVAVVAYAVLVVALVVRVVRHRRELRADVTNPARAFGFFTLVAGSSVLAAQLAAEQRVTVARALALFAGLAWLALGPGIPAALIVRSGSPPALIGANGTWFNWVVATQSVAVAATALPAHPALAALATACWSVGVVLYLLVAALVLAARLMFETHPADVTPAYWVFMGATAISVLAGAQLLRQPPEPLTTATRPVIAGLSVALWAFGTWLIAPLLVTGAWRHLRHRVPLRYEPALWSMVFPIGMYGVACHELGVTLGVSWLATFGRDEAWVALAVWGTVFAGLLVAEGPCLGRRAR